MASVSVTSNGTTVTLASPYSENLPPRARALGGKFDRAEKVWTFDARDEQRVRDLAREIYGTDGSDADEPGVTIRVNVLGVAGKYGAAARTLTLVGHELAYRPARDEDVRLGRGVVVIKGGFTASGGSMKYPALDDLSGIVIEVRDLSRGTAERALAEYPEHVSLIGEGLDREALRAERARLAARLAEIDALLSEA